jgi:hypothetical protein
LLLLASGAGGGGDGGVVFLAWSGAVQFSTRNAETQFPFAALAGRGWLPLYGPSVSPLEIVKPTVTVGGGCAWDGTDVISMTGFFALWSTW